MFRKLFVVLVGLYAAAGTFAYGSDSQQPKMTAAEFEASLKYQKGEIGLPGDMATLKIPDTFRRLDPKDAERVLVQAWGNPSGKDTLGMLFPVGISPVSETSWGVVITYEEDGYVSDKDADSTVLITMIC